VLLLCVENACRSLMAEAMFNALPPPGWAAASAGTKPAQAPNPRTASMLAEIGLELPKHPPRLATAQMLSEAELRISMGCLDDRSCPAYLRELEVRDWAVPDPAPLADDGFRRVRDSLRRRVAELVRELS
jgi:arsenate reductase